MTHFSVLVMILVGVVGLLVTTLAGLGWVYKRGGADQQQLAATRANTTATATLSSAFDHFSESMLKTVSDHEHRITRNEDQTADNRERLGRLENKRERTARRDEAARGAL